MCGRFTLTKAPAEIIEAFQVHEVASFPPRFNIAPAQPVAVVRTPADHAGRELASLIWGLVPSWSKDPTSGFINARAETVASKPAFRTPFRRRRCLVPSDGFFEWKKNGKKQPYYFRLPDGQAFAFAGLWDRWQGKEGESLETCALLTTEANATVRPVHHRMPVILQPQDYNTWLNPEFQDMEGLQQLLRPYPAVMTAYPVGLYVNNASHQGPACITPADLQDGPRG